MKHNDKHITYEIAYMTGGRRMAIILPPDVTDHELRVAVGYIEAMRSTLQQAKREDETLALE